MPDLRITQARQQIIEMCGDPNFELEVAATIAASEQVDGVGPSAESCRPEARVVLNRVRKAMNNG